MTPRTKAIVNRKITRYPQVRILCPDFSVVIVIEEANALPKTLELFSLNILVQWNGLPVEKDGFVPLSIAEFSL